MTVRDPADERACLLLAPLQEVSLTSRLDAVTEEMRVARLIAHMRPYLPSSTAAATQPMRAIPAQRAAPHQERYERLVDSAYGMTRTGRRPGFVPNRPRP